MTPEELQEVVAAVIAALKTNGKTIDQLTAVTSLADTDNLEISNGKKVSFGKLKELVAAAVTVSAEEIKGWEMIESTEDLPEDPTQVQQEKAYVLADTSTMYVYVGSGGDTLSGKYQSLAMKGPKGNPGTPLGETEIVDGLDSEDAEKVLSANQGRVLKGMIDSKTFDVVDDLTTGGRESALSAEQGKVLGQKVSVIGDTETEITPAQVLTKKYVSTGGAINNSSNDTTCVAFYEIHGRKLTVSVGKTVNSACRTLTYATSLDQTSNLVQADSKVGDGQAYSKVIDAPSSAYKYLCICYNNEAENEVVEQYPQIDTLELQEDMATLNDSVDDMSADFNDTLSGAVTEYTTPVEGKYYNMLYKAVGDTLPEPPADNAGLECLLIEVKAGAILTIYTKGGSNARAWVVTDANKVILSMADSGADYSVTPHVLPITKDGYVAINNNVANTNFNVKVVYKVLPLIDGLDTRVDTIEGALTKYRFPKYYNNPFPVYKDTIKVLAIGNSYTEDSTAYLSELVAASGIDTSKLCVYTCITSNSSLANWATWYSNNTAKALGKKCGELSVGTTAGTLAQLLAQDWDVVIVQQLSGDAPDYTTYNPALTTLVKAIRTHCTNQKVCVGFNLIWRYKEGYNTLTPQGEARWVAICDAIKHMAVVDGVDFILPTGTAIENARNTTEWGSNTGELTRDGTHLGYGVGRYIAACTWYQMLLAPIFGVPIIGNSATHEIGSGETGTTYEGIAVTNSKKLLCQQCAMSATIDMFGVSAV